MSKRIGVLELVASSRGGGAVHVRDLAVRLDRTRLAVRVAMPEDGGSVTAQDVTSTGIPFHRLDIASGFSVHALEGLRALATEVDILHAHGARAALFGRLAALTLGPHRPLVAYTIHGFAAPYYSAPKRQALLLVERGLAPVTDTWICVSQAEKDALLASEVAHADRVQVIRNGVDPAPFAMAIPHRDDARSELGLSGGAFVITTICRLHRPRDFPTLLEAFQRVRLSLPSAELLLVGDGPQRRQVEQLVHSLGVMDHVHLLGMRRDVPEILAATDVYVLSSQGWEGLPLTVLEAMAASLPVVASDVGGTGEAVIHEQTGYLFAAGDVSTLTSHLIALARQPALARCMGQQGLQRVSESFTVERMVRQTASTYEQLLDTRARRGEASASLRR